MTFEIGKVYRDEMQNRWVLIGILGANWKENMDELLRAGFRKNRGKLQNFSHEEIKKFPFLFLCLASRFDANVSPFFDVFNSDGEYSGNLGRKISKEEVTGITIPQAILNIIQRNKRMESKIETKFEKIPAEIEFGDFFKHGGSSFSEKPIVFVGKADKDNLKIYASFFNRIEKNHHLYMELSTIEKFPYVFVSFSKSCDTCYFYNLNSALITPEGGALGPLTSTKTGPVELQKIAEEIREKLEPQKEKPPMLKKFVVNKSSKNLYCVDQEGNFVKFGNEKTTEVISEAGLI